MSVTGLVLWNEPQHDGLIHSLCAVHGDFNKCWLLGEDVSWICEQADHLSLITVKKNPVFGFATR